MDCFCSKLHVTIQCKIILLDEQELIHEMPVRIYLFFLIPLINVLFKKKNDFFEWFL